MINSRQRGFLRGAIQTLECSNGKKKNKGSGTPGPMKELKLDLKPTRRAKKEISMKKKEVASRAPP